MPQTRLLAALVLTSGFVCVPAAAALAEPPANPSCTTTRGLTTCVTTTVATSVSEPQTGFGYGRDGSYADQVCSWGSPGYDIYDVYNLQVELTTTTTTTTTRRGAVKSAAPLLSSGTTKSVVITGVVENGNYSLDCRWYY